MEIFQKQYSILAQTEIYVGCYELIIDCPEVADQAECGQFVNIKVEGKILRRPISICNISRKTGTIRLVYEVRGEGTKILSCLQQGDKIDILGPLGKGFKFKKEKSNILIIGGGIGVPPLLQTAINASLTTGKKADAILGFRSEKNIMLIQDFKAACRSLEITTDDGSYAYHGYVTDLMENRVKAQKTDMILACGPSQMLAAIAKFAADKKIDCQVSLEERMGCGVGSCLVCACKTSNNEYKHVCSDGPVFNATTVSFN